MEVKSKTVKEWIERGGKKYFQKNSSEEKKG